MKNIKNYILLFLIITALFLSYKILNIKQISDIEESETIETIDVFKYAKYFSFSPNREIFDAIDYKLVNEQIISSLEINSYEKLEDFSAFKDFKFKESGRLLIPSFNFPTSLFSNSLNVKNNFKFAEIRGVFLGRDYVLYNTEDGVYKYKSKSVDFKEAKMFFSFDEDLNYKNSTNVNFYAEEENLVQNLSYRELNSIAEEFLQQNNFYETEQQDGYIFNTDLKSLEILINGEISFSQTINNVDERLNLLDSLVNLKKFVLSMPLNFKNYRIVNLIEFKTNLDDSSFIVELLPEESIAVRNAYKDGIYVKIQKNRVSEFRSMYVNASNYSDIFRKPEIEGLKVDTSLNNYFLYERKGNLLELKRIDISEER